MKEPDATDLEPPPKPGEKLLEVLQARHMSQSQLARRLGRPKRTVNEIVKGRTAITADTAVQLEHVLGLPAGHWLELEAKYREYLERTRMLTIEPPAAWQERLIEIAAGAGVAVAFSPGLAGAPVVGATRWLSPRLALIQLSLACETEDQLWFTYFHQMYHLLFHGKKQGRGLDRCRPRPRACAHQTAAQTSRRRGDGRPATQTSPVLTRSTRGRAAARSPGGREPAPRPTRLRRRQTESPDPRLPKYLKRRRRPGLPIEARAATLAPGGGPDAPTPQAHHGLAEFQALVARSREVLDPYSSIAPRFRNRFHSSARRSLSALPITDTELKLIAAAAIIGDSSTPKKG